MTLPRSNGADTGADEIVTLTRHGAQQLSARMALIDPWLRLGIDAQALYLALTQQGTDMRGYEARAGGEAHALITYRTGWLYGPYIRLLAVMPEAQGRGTGSLLVQHVIDDARAQGARNVWVCASAFNAGALTFYERLQFERIGQIGNLVTDGEAEILLRLDLGRRTPAG